MTTATPALAESQSPATVPAAPRVACTWRNHRAGRMSDLYATIASDTSTAQTRSQADDVARLLMYRRPFNGGWHLQICKRLREEGRHPDNGIHVYAGEPAAIERLGEFYPQAMRIEAVDRQLRTGVFLASTTAVAPAHLLTAEGIVLPDCRRSRGQLAIDLAFALDAPCLLAHHHDTDPSLAMLHSCTARFEESALERHGRWRMTFLERIGAASHDYVDPHGPADVASLVGSAIDQGYRSFVGHRPSDIDPRLQGGPAH